MYTFSVSINTTATIAVARTPSRDKTRALHGRFWTLWWWENSTIDEPDNNLPTGTKDSTREVSPISILNSYVVRIDFDGGCVYIFQGV